MSRDHLDALLDQMLREIIGGDRPRDMTARILARATMRDRLRRQWWISAGAAIAACLAIAVSLFFLWPRQYPEPEFAGVIPVEPGQTVGAGPTLRTTGAPGTIKLGGYVQMTMDPNTQFRIGGKRLAEELFLDSGRVNVAVTKKKGTFDVDVGPVDVHVIGTQFSVDVSPKIADGIVSKHIVVAVMDGSVWVNNGDTTSTVKAGDPPLQLDITLPPVQELPEAASPDGEGSSGMVTGARAGARLGVRPARRGEIPPPPSATAPNPPANQNPLPAALPTPAALPVPRPAATPPLPGARINPANIPQASPTAFEATMSPDADIESDGQLVQRNGRLFIQNGTILIPLPAADALLSQLPSTTGTLHVHWVKGKVTSITPTPAAGKPSPALR